MLSGKWDSDDFISYLNTIITMFVWEGGGYLLIYYLSLSKIPCAVVWFREGDIGIFLSIVFMKFAAVTDGSFVTSLSCRNMN